MRKELPKSSAGAPHVCVVGSGPAGMVLALELAGLDCDVTLVESGTHVPNRTAQGLSDAVFGVPGTHALMEDAVHRRWGGTSHLWGGRCVPYDPADLDIRRDGQEPAWPLSLDELSVNFGKACLYADCGTPQFSLNDIYPNGAFSPICEGFIDGDIRSDQLERWSASPVMVRRLGREIRKNPRILVLTGMTCTGVATRDGGGAISAITLRATDGNVKRQPDAVKADLFVLACGGVESTRLLLHFARQRDPPRMDGRTHLGRGYMGHLFGQIASIRLRGNPEKTVFGFERVKNHYVRRRFTISDRVRRAKALLNISFSLDNPPASDPAHGSGILSAAYVAMRSPLLGARLAPAGIRKALFKAERPGTMQLHLKNIAASLPATARFAATFLYARYWGKPPRLPGFFIHSASNCYALYYHAEQSPSDASRIELDDSVDRLGMPRAKLSLRFAADDAASVVRSHEVLDAHLRHHQLGELEYWYPEDERMDAVLRQATDGFHQIGTTRMSQSPQHGVTDSYGRVFGTQNLFVCSSSVFPTSGQANPTFTLLAFAIRQAKFVASSLREKSESVDLSKGMRSRQV